VSSGRNDVVILGGGLNSLVAACVLAKAGRRPLLLERRDEVGGTASTSTLAPGFKVPTLMHGLGPLRPTLVAELGLEKHGLTLLESETLLTTFDGDGRALVIARDPRRAAEAIGAFSADDATRYIEFDAAVGRIAGALAPLLDTLPPDIDKPRLGELASLFGTARRIKGLGKRDLIRLLRFMPMAAADLAAEWFETEALRAAVAARAILGQSAGPWSAGTGAVYFMRAAADPHALGTLVTPRGGPGALAAALAASARAAGAVIRTGADVVRLETRDGAVATVVLASGDRIDAPVVVSGLDPKRTLLALLQPDDLGPEFRRRVRNIRSRGVTAKVNLALDRLPSFGALKDRGTAAAAALSGRIIVGHEIDALERAYDASKYGRTSEAPFIEATIPSLLDPSLAPDGKHVLSALVQFVPYHAAEGDIALDRDAVGDRVVQSLARHAPDLPGLVTARQVLTPRDLEADWGLTEGHLFQGEEALDQFFTMRPILGWARHKTPVRGLYLCGAGTHPGGGLTGANGRNAARAVLAEPKG